MSDVLTDPLQRRRHVIIDLCICVGLPIVVMIWCKYTRHDLVSRVLTSCVVYVVQGHRFNILEEIGCMPATFNTPLAYVLVYMWPLLLGLVSMVYCCTFTLLYSPRRCSHYAFRYHCPNARQTQERLVGQPWRVLIPVPFEVYAPTCSGFSRRGYYRSLRCLFYLR